LGVGRAEEVARPPAKFQSPADRADWVRAKPCRSDERYGLFEKDASVLSFFDDPKGESVLTDIKARNARDGAGNVKIPGTAIELINFSYCPDCGAVHAMQDLANAYAAPQPDMRMSRIVQMRRDVRVSCRECGALFLPTLVISDGTPRDECRFLCRIQTIDAIETHCAGAYGRQVLSRKKGNVRLRRGKSTVKALRGIRMDIGLAELADRPTLIANLMQYTPPPDMLALISGQTPQGAVIYDMWF